MNLPHLSTSTPASEISSASFDDGSNSADLEVKSLDDILRNSPAAELLGLNKESLPEEGDDVPSPDEVSEEEAQEENDTESENDLDEEEESSDSEEEDTAEDDTSTQDTDLPSEEDIDWEYKVPVTVDGKTEYVTLEEIRKGYSTDKHLSQKGRELGELKKQLEAKATQDESAAVEADSKIEISFSATVNDGIEKVLKDVIWKNSVLRDISTDTPDMKETKAYFRESLAADAMKAFNSGDAKGKLLSEFKQGRAATTQYKTAFTKAVEDAVVATKKQTAITSNLLAKVYGTQRNSQIAPPKPPPTQPAGLTPSTPTDFAPTEARSRDDVKKNFEEFFKSQTAVNG